MLSNKKERHRGRFCPPAFEMTVKDFVAYIQSLNWNSLAPSVLKSLLSSRNICTDDVTSLHLAEVAMLTTMILECYSVNNDVTASQK
jgi:hypothetical protein